MKIRYEYSNSYNNHEMINFLRDKGVKLEDIDTILKTQIFYACEVELDTITMKVKLISMNGLSDNVEK